MSDPRGGLPYWAWFGVLVAGSVGVLLVIVFAVFPPRFVLAPGLREQGLDFPSDAPDFEVAARAELARPRPPREEAPETTPAERFWSRVGGLVETGRDEAALAVFRDWLEDRPGDRGARLEYARALERTGRLLRAERAYRRAVDAGAGREARLALARLLWRLGDLRAALSRYDALADGRPGDRTVRRERADLLAALGRHREAARAYRDLLEEAPDAPEAGVLRLELARALFAAGSPAAAWRQASAVPAGSPAARDAAALKEQLRAAMPLPAADTVVGSALARARTAAADGDLRRAETLYRAALLLRPGDETARLELAALLAERMDAAGEAAAVLGAALDRRGPGPSPELRRRLARYRVWAGDEAGALRVLERLAAEGGATADDLALLGDLLRWRGRRHQAAGRYDAALALEPGHGRALKGKSALREAVRRVVDARDPAGAGVESDLYVDSDDYRSWGVAGRAVLDPGWETHRIVARSGLRSLRGPSAAGPVVEETGPVGEVGWVGWWRQATVRTELTVGAEHFGATGTEPTVGAGVRVPRLGLEAAYRHGLAHPTTLTLASVRDRTRIDRLRASLFRPLGGEGWDLWTSLEAASLRGGGVDNGRLVAQAAVDRPVGLGGRLRAGYATRLLTTAEPAPPAGGGRAAYWSPGLSWTHAASLELSRPRGETGWGWRVELQPGASLVRLHGDEAATEVELSLYGEGGLEYRTGPTSVRLQAEYARSRLGGYEAFGASLDLTWRF